VTIGDEVTANLLGPVVVNVRNRVGRQVVLAHQDLTTAAPIRPVD
jgi:flagellar assembly factor FliW